MSDPEPWLRGPLEGVHPLVMPVFFSFAQVREDLKRHLDGLSDEQIWRLFGKASIGFHLKHIAGSVERLVTYLKGQVLTDDQLRELKEEHTPDLGLPELMVRVEARLHDAETYLDTIDPNSLYDKRGVGRKALPTTVIGLLVHVAEHTQRHLGQAITLSRVIRQSN